ncbi:MAG: Mur ligase family protein [Propionibacteriaceae bacterium]
MTATICLWVAVAVTIALTDLRFWRVAQREHYIPGRASYIAMLWTKLRVINAIIVGLGIGCALASIYTTAAYSIAWPGLGVLLLALWPLGLGITGRTSKLNWTARLKRLALVTVALQLICAVILAFTPAVALAAVAALPLLELAVFIMDKVEKKMAGKYVVQAKQRLAQVDPTVVAITGSYGKTSTKGYVAHLLSAAVPVVASPASFNNLMGLSRSINDRLVPDTEVFIAEMGTYGPGEIRELCREFHPDIAAITTIGEAHLERMKNRETIVAAKTEITEDAHEIVLNIDVPELADLADRLSAEKIVVRTSANPGSGADVIVAPSAGKWEITVDGTQIATIEPPFAGHPTNVAIALGIAKALDIAPDKYVSSLATLPGAPHRAEAALGPGDVWLIDDTYNSNPVGAAAAVAAAVERAGEHQVYVVTPGMVELGNQQAVRNAELGRHATAQPNMTLAVVGYTNRAALVSQANPEQVRLFANRQAAVEAIIAEAKPGDVILYENDLPDHYA